jgi:hypothetical protein
MATTSAVVVTATKAKTTARGDGRRVNRRGVEVVGSISGQLPMYSACHLSTGGLCCSAVKVETFLGSSCARVVVWTLPIRVLLCLLNPFL